MTDSHTLTALLVRDYDEAIAFYTQAMGFELRTDQDRGGGKRWVVVAPAGGGVFLLLQVVDFQRMYQRLQAHGVRFIELPRHEEYGTVVVFLDLYGNKWDLVGPRSA